jgi:hypothetical protein
MTAVDMEGHADPSRPKERNRVPRSRRLAGNNDLASLGLIDDIADGIIEVNLRSSSPDVRGPAGRGTRGGSAADICARQLLVRTIADEIEQARLGPTPPDWNRRT